MVAPKPKPLINLNPNAMKPIPGIRPPPRPPNQEQSQIDKKILAGPGLKSKPLVNTGEQPVKKYATGAIPMPKEQMERIMKHGLRP